MEAKNFLRSNWSYILWLIIYFSIAWAILGGNLNSFIIVSLIYGVSISVALSPIGETILQATEDLREPATEEEINYLLPMFEEVYEYAKEENPNLNDDIKLYIMDTMHVNAYAIGRKTVAVTRGAIATFSADQLKGIIAHELGHITHGHTKALLLSFIGNFFFAIIVWILRLLFSLAQTISNMVARTNVMGISFSLITYVFRLGLDLSVFVFINLSEMVLASNSRTNEIQADTFAYEIGYGRELMSGMYILQKLDMNAKLTLTERLKASHPHMAYRIANLENLENEELEV